MHSLADFQNRNGFRKPKHTDAPIVSLPAVRTAANEVGAWDGSLVVRAMHSRIPADSVRSMTHKTERMVLGGWGSVRLNEWSWEVGGQSD